MILRNLALVIFVSFFLLLEGYAEEFSTLYSVEGDSVVLVNKYSEGDLFYIDKFKVTPGQLQDLVSRKSFKDQSHQLKEWGLYADWLSYSHLSNSVLDISDLKLDDVPPLWIVKNKWSASWEKKYFDWVSENFDINFFATYNIATDCADAAIALRWIFARINKLPVGNKLSATRKLFTQDSVKKSWLKLSTHSEWHKDKRFLKAIDYVMNTTYTKTLYYDSYPIQLTSESFKPGIFNLDLIPTNGHTRIISKVNYSEESLSPITLLSSNLPKTVRSLLEESIFFIKKPYFISDGNNNSFRNMNWIVKEGQRWKMMPMKSGLYYSDEQKTKKFEGSNFGVLLLKILGINFDPMKAIDDAIAELVDYIANRFSVVEKGYEACKKINCAPGTRAWDDWSTPSRDKKIIAKHEALLQLVYDFENIVSEVNLRKYVYDKSREAQWVINKVDYSLSDIIYLFKSKSISSDPRQPIEDRWGINYSKLVDEFKKRALEYVDKRKKIIPPGGPACTSPCLIGSEEYQEKSTSTLDMSVFGLMDSIVVLKQNLTSKKVDELIDRLLGEDSVTIGGRQVSLLDLISTVPFMSSNPNHTYEKRWSFKNSSAIEFKYGDRVIAYKGYQIVDGMMFNKPGLLELKAPVKSYINPYSAEWPFYGYEESQSQFKVFIFKSTEGEWIELKNEDGAPLDGHVSLLDKDHLVEVNYAKGNAKIYKIDAAKSTATLVLTTNHFSLLKNSYNEVEVFLVSLLNKNRLYIVDSGTFKDYDLQKIDSPHNSYSQLKRQKNGLILYSQYGDLISETIIDPGKTEINLTDIEREPYGESYASINLGLYLAKSYSVEAGGYFYKVYRINEEGLGKLLVSSQGDLVDVEEINGDLYIVVYDDSGKTNLMKWNGANFETVSMGETTRFADHEFPYIIWGDYSKGITFLENLEDGKKIELPKGYYIASNFPVGSHFSGSSLVLLSDGVAQFHVSIESLFSKSYYEYSSIAKKGAYSSYATWKIEEGRIVSLGNQKWAWLPE